MRKKAAEKMDRLKNGLFENGSYKLVALFIALILWLTILGRREFVVNKEIDVEFTVAANLMISEQSSEKIRIKISGPQPLLKKYKESSQPILISLVDKTSGVYEIDMTAARVEAPAGIKILSLKPSQIRVEITPKEN